MGWLAGKAGEHWKEVAGFAGGAALLAFVVATSDLGKVAQGFERFRYGLIPVVFALIAGREAVRVVEWRLLLRRLGIRARWRHSILALLSGDAAQLVPGGIYLSNLVLKREEDANVARSLAATWATQLLEAFVCLAVLASVGVAGWPWLRPAAAVVLAGFIGFLFLVTRPAVAEWLDRRQAGNRLLDKILDGLKQFLVGEERILDSWLIGRAGFLAAAHLAFTVAALYVISRGLGIDNVSWWQMAAVYAFVLALVNLNPLPTDLGVSEGGGMSIFVATGVDQAQGLTAMLLIRFAIILATVLLLGIALAVFPREVKHLADGADPEDARANAAADPNSAQSVTTSESARRDLVGRGGLGQS
jgi:uncharacterized membrane protein YbhN (UPF0104 family)